MNTCIHGIQSKLCGYCNGTKKVGSRINVPKNIPSNESLVNAAAALTKKELPVNNAISIRPKRGHPSLVQLGPNITFIHFLERPAIWLIEEVLAKCPNLKTVQFLPNMLSSISPAQKELLSNKKVNFTSGHWKPEAAWAGPRILSPDYHVKKEFLMDLSGDQLKLFQELLDLGFDEALLASRYFCLKGEDFISQRECSEKFDLNFKIKAIGGSLFINAVISYLDPHFKVSNDTKLKMETMRKSVFRIREMLQNKNEMDNLLSELQITKLPDNLTLSKIEKFSSICKAYNSGQLSLLKEKRHAEILTQRWGLNNGCFKTLEAVGELFSVTRERIRQIEAESLDTLRIID